MKSFFPTARRNAILEQNMDDELVLYDTLNDKANLLNRTAALIWQQCDGKSTPREIAARVSLQLGAPVDESVVWYTLNQLSDKNLLQTSVAMPHPFQHLTRRDFLRAGLVGAAVVLPVVVTMTAPKVSQAASCVASAEPCDSSTNCCSGGVGACSDGSCP